MFDAQGHYALGKSVIDNGTETVKPEKLWDRSMKDGSLFS